MKTVTTLHRCKRCGNLLENNYATYCPNCSPIIEKVRNRERCRRYRLKHGNKLVIDWCKKHPEARKQHMKTYMKKHKDLLVEKNRQYRNQNPIWYAEQLRLNNDILKKRRKTECRKCGKPKLKSAQMPLCKKCAFERWLKKYEKKKLKNRLLSAKERNEKLLDEFDLLIPMDLPERWRVDYGCILKEKVRLGMITSDGGKIPWNSSAVSKVWNRNYNMPRNVYPSISEEDNESV